jgi:glutathione S-transferase
MLTIYGVYRSRASRNIWLAKELGIPFRHVPVIQAARSAKASAGSMNTKSAEFLAINPNGHIPAVDDGGVRLHESLAINLYLAKKHGGPLAPVDVVEDGEMMMWSLWAATEVEPHSIQIIYHRVDHPPAKRDAAIARDAVEALRAPFAVLDRHLSRTSHITGGRFTVADINVAEVLRYAMPAPELFDAVPHVKSWLAACHGRRAYREMMAEREAEAA